MDAFAKNTDQYLTLDASGLAVGLPDGLMGNSEVGHLNIGAGRVIYQACLSKHVLETMKAVFFFIFSTQISYEWYLLPNLAVIFCASWHISVVQILVNVYY